jgi:hypothetical protein
MARAGRKNKTKPKKRPAPKRAKRIKRKAFSLSNFISSYFDKNPSALPIIITAFILGVIIGSGGLYFTKKEAKIPVSAAKQESYWFVLHRKSNEEFLYKGVPGDISQSALVKTFRVKTGVPGEKPTPLPHLLGRDYWIIIGKMKSDADPETSPYFLTLDVPVSYFEPYGPVPYVECEGQCSWTIPGFFGLHGVGGDNSKLASEDPGSSGCVRHSDQDITYLYNLIDPNREEIRYYIKDI